MSEAGDLAAGSGGPFIPLDRLRVLVVEDVWILADSLRSLLENMGVGVIGPAVSLDAAVAAAVQGSFDVALMDLDLDGQTTHGLIGDLCARGYPVILVTGNEVPQETGRLTTAVLAKPVRAEHLLQILRRVPARPRPAAFAPEAG